MKLFIIVFSILFSVNLFATQNRNQGQVSRRGFLSGLLGAGAVAVVNPMSVLSSGFGAVNVALPEALKRHIVRMRLKTVSVVGESVTGKVTDPFLGLKNYVKFLEELALDPRHANYNAALLNKLKAAKQSLVMFEQAYLKNLGKGLESSSNSETKSIDSNSSGSKRGQLSREVSPEHLAAEAEQQEFLLQLQELPMDLRIITIRSLLGLDHLRRMAWQVHYSGIVEIESIGLSHESFEVQHPINSSTVILSLEEMKLIRQYRFYLLETLHELLTEKTFLNAKGMLEGFENISMAELLLNQFLEESNLVIQAYETAQDLNNYPLQESFLSCNGYLN